MHLNVFASLVTLSLLGGSLRAAEASAAPSPAPVVIVPSTPAPTIASAPAPIRAPNQIVYTQRLPSPAELTNAAAAQGLAVERIEQSPTQVLATYRTASGQTNVVSYQTLPPAGTDSSNYVTTVPATPPTVIYERPEPRVVYYYDDPIYFPRVWYPPVSLSLGFGFGGGHSHGGGFRHGR
jgi:hypothetical protein